MHFRVAELAAATRSIVCPVAGNCSSPAAIDAAQLESRVLFSASPLAMLVQEVPDVSDAGMQIAEVGDDVSSAFDSALSSGLFDVEALDESTAPMVFIPFEMDMSSGRETSVELVFIDANAGDVNQLVNDLLEQQGNERSFEICLLDGNGNGIEQISEVLAGRSGIDAIHLVSHGTEGKVKLGDTWLSNNNIDSYAGEIAGWSNALGDGRTY